MRRRFDPPGARRELATLLNASDGGFIGHTIFWAHEIDWQRALRYNVASRHALSTGTIQPPLLAWAWRIAVGDPSLEPRIAEHHAWLRAHRDLDGDGLLWLIQPDESGMDALPKFDHVWGRLAQGLPLFPLLVARNRRLGFDAARVVAKGHPVVCEVLTNVLWSLAEQALGRPSPTPTLIARLYDERTGRFADDVRNAVHPTPPAQRPATWDTLAPLALPDLPEEIGRRLVEEVLLAPRFWDGVPLPAVALDDPTHSSRERWWGRHRHWRGPSWVNSAWLVSLGLRRLGYDDAGRRPVPAAVHDDRARGLPGVLRVARRLRDGRPRLRLVDPRVGDRRARSARRTELSLEPGAAALGAYRNSGVVHLSIPEEIA